MILKLFITILSHKSCLTIKLTIQKMLEVSMMLEYSLFLTMKDISLGQIKQCIKQKARVPVCSDSDGCRDDGRLKIQSVASRRVTSPHLQATASVSILDGTTETTSILL